MKSFHLDVTENKSIEIYSVNLIILFYLFRTAIPFFKFPFLLLYTCFIVYSIVKYKNQIFSTLKAFVHNYFLILILALILVISFLFSNKLYLSIFKDVVNMIILLSIFLMSTVIITSKKEFKVYVSSMVYLIILFALVICITNLLDVFEVFTINSFSIFSDIGGSSTYNNVIDNNFSLLPVFFALVGVFYLLGKTNSRRLIVYYNILLIIYSFNIILSGSRRGWITLIIIFMILALLRIAILFRENNYFKELIISSRFYILSMISIIILLSMFFFCTSYSFKNTTLKYLGSKNVVLAKYKISYNLYRCVAAIDGKLSFTEFYRKLWTLKFIPEDPDSGWGSRFHKTVFPLKGRNVQIVPVNAKGYLMDSTCNGSYYPGDNISESFSILTELNTTKGDRFKASVYCFASDSFNVNSLALGVPDACIKNKIVSGNSNALYDFSNKAIWQKLNIEFVSNGGNVPILISFWKRGVKNFLGLKGYVIFAYPTYEKIPSDSLSINISHSGTKTGPSQFDRMRNDIAQNYYETLNQPEENYNNSSSVHTISINSNLKLYKYKSLNILLFPFSILPESGSIQNDPDLVRKLASRFISEDTTYYPYKSGIVLNPIPNPFLGDRISRWEFAFNIYKKEFNWRQKVFGGGFNFLNWFGYYFDHDKTRSDYPHNPFLSVLLYSGIMGLIIYLILMYKVFYYYIKYFKEYKILSVFFLITFYFSFFSAGSPFDPPIMGFFVILPFFIHSILKKGKTEVR